MNRRAFVTGLGAVLAAPLGVEAQQAGKVYQLAVLSNVPPPTPSLAAEIVSHKPDLIVALPNAGVATAKQATSTIPIVMVYVFDPIRVGLVASLARPGGNVTGLTFDVGPEMVGKYLELLKEVLPNISFVGVAGNPELCRARWRPHSSWE
jgi:ABC-type uncharacterized transport system substrate-binding protein